MIITSIIIWKNQILKKKNEKSNFEQSDFEIHFEASNVENIPINEPTICEVMNC